MNLHSNRLISTVACATALAVSMIAAPTYADTTCTGKWRSKYNSSFVFNDAGTTVIYNIDEERFDSVPLAQKRKHLEFLVGNNGAKITIRRQGKHLWAKYSHKGNGTRTKLTCPVGFKLPVVG